MEYYIYKIMGKIIKVTCVPRILMEGIISCRGQHSDRQRILNDLDRRLLLELFVTLAQITSRVNSRCIYSIGDHYDALLQDYLHSFMNFMYPQNKGLFKSNVASVAQLWSILELSNE